MKGSRKFDSKFIAEGIDKLLMHLSSTLTLLFSVSRVVVLNLPDAVTL